MEEYAIQRRRPVELYDFGLGEERADHRRRRPAKLYDSIEEIADKSKNCPRNFFQVTKDNVCRDCKMIPIPTLERIASALELEVEKGDYESDYHAQLCEAVGEAIAKLRRQKAQQDQPRDAAGGVIDKSFNMLPFDVQKSIISRLDTLTLLNACQTNDTIRGFCNNPKFWQYLWGVKFPGFKDMWLNTNNSVSASKRFYMSFDKAIRPKAKVVDLRVHKYDENGVLQQEVGKPPLCHLYFIDNEQLAIVIAEQRLLDGDLILSDHNVMWYVLWSGDAVPMSRVLPAQAYDRVMRIGERHEYWNESLPENIKHLVGDSAVYVPQRRLDRNIFRPPRHLNNGTFSPIVTGPTDDGPNTVPQTTRNIDIDYCAYRGYSSVLALRVAEELAQTYADRNRDGCIAYLKANTRLKFVSQANSILLYHSIVSDETCHGQIEGAMFLVEDITYARVVIKEWLSDHNSSWTDGSDWCEFLSGANLIPNLFTPEAAVPASPEYIQEAFLYCQERFFFRSSTLKRQLPPPAVGNVNAPFSSFLAWDNFENSIGVLATVVTTGLAIGSPTFEAEKRRITDEHKALDNENWRRIMQSLVQMARPDIKNQYVLENLVNKVYFGKAGKGLSTTLTSRLSLSVFGILEDVNAPWYLYPYMGWSSLFNRVPEDKREIEQLAVFLQRAGGIPEEMITAIVERFTNATKEEQDDRSSFDVVSHYPTVEEFIHLLEEGILGGQASTVRRTGNKLLSELAKSVDWKRPELTHLVGDGPETTIISNTQQTTSLFWDIRRVILEEDNHEALLVLALKNLDILKVEKAAISAQLTNVGLSYEQALADLSRHITELKRTIAGAGHDNFSPLIDAWYERLEPVVRVEHKQILYKGEKEPLSADEKLMAFMLLQIDLGNLDEQPFYASRKQSVMQQEYENVVDHMNIFMWRGLAQTVAAIAAEQAQEAITPFQDAFPKVPTRSDLANFIRKQVLARNLEDYGIELHYDPPAFERDMYKLYRIEFSIDLFQEMLDAYNANDTREVARLWDDANNALQQAEQRRRAPLEQAAAAPAQQNGEEQEIARALGVAVEDLHGVAEEERGLLQRIAPAPVVNNVE